MKEIPNWSPDKKPIYDIEKSYLDNALFGPFFEGEIPSRTFLPKEEWGNFLGFPIASRLGVPAGPLLNAKWITLAAKLGFDILTYKTIRSAPYPGHSLPNMIYVDIENDSAVQKNSIASLDELTVTNSFGMPSMDQSFLLEDIPRARESLAEGQLLIVSVVGAGKDFEELKEDFVKAALLAKRATAPVIEVNFSCPNVKSAEGVLYQNPEKVLQLSQALSLELGDTPIIAKVGDITDRSLLADLLHALEKGKIAAISGLNSVSMPVVDRAGNSPLGPDRKKSGICGDGIREQALSFVQSTREIIKRDALGLSLIGVGGITSAEHFTEFLTKGADVAMCATGMMWDPYLALRHHKIREEAHV